MTAETVPGRTLEIVFTDADRVVDVEAGDDDQAIAATLVEAIRRDDPDDAERILREGIAGVVRRRR